MQIALKDQLQAPSGLFTLLVYRHGQLIEEFIEKNLIVDGSKTTHAHLLGGDVANRSITKIGFGTNGALPSAGNTGLANGALIKTIDSVSYPASNEVAFNFSLGAGEGNGLAILEFGLITGGNVLYARKVRSTALNKEADLSFAGSWIISY